MFNSYYEKVAQKTVKIDKDIPFDIPSNWQWVRLSEITNTISAGGDRPDVFSKIKTEQCQIPIFSNGIESDGLYGYTNTAKIYDRSITVSARGTIGFSCIRNEPYVPIVRLISVVPNVNISLDYLYIFFSGAMESGDGTSTPQLTVPNIKQKFIALPPREEQDRIVRIVNTATGIIKKIAVFQNDLFELCSQLKSAILAVFFGENSRYKSYYTEKPLKEIAKIVFGQSPDGSTVIATHTKDSIEFHQGKTAFGKYYLDESNRWCVEPTKITNGNSIVMSVRAPVGDVNICNRVICIGRGLCSIEPYSNINEKYLFYLLLSKKQYLESKSTGSTFSAVNSNTVKEMNIVVCEDNIQNQIVEKIEQAFSLLDGIVS